MDQLALKSIIDELCRQHKVNANDSPIGMQRDIRDFLKELQSGDLWIVPRPKAE